MINNFHDHDGELPDGVPARLWRGRRIAGIARNELEKDIGHSVVSKKNYLPGKKPKKSSQGI